ncbi:MAG: hypothetical protein QM764_15145 [Chitinophagaceae bacterium]
MDTKKTIRKLLFTITGLLAGTGILVLLISAIGEKKKGQCTDYKITIKSLHNDHFIDDKDVYKLLSSATGGAVKGQAIAAINTQKLEDLLENSAWINDAQLYFDNKNVLHVAITEREPLARIFTIAGNSFYIDSSIKRIPLSDKMSARVPVFTGFPDKNTLTQSDSTLLGDMKTVAKFVAADSFWSAQVSEIDITPEKNFEITPVVGNNILRIGDAVNLEQKFHRLYLFYDRVLSKSGFDKYKVIDAQFDGQIVAMRKGEKMNAVDTAKLKLNVQRLIRQSLETRNDTMVTARNIVTGTATLNPADRGTMIGQDENNAKPSSPNPLKLSVKKNPTVKPATKKVATSKEKPKKEQKKEAKAVMKKTSNRQ